MKEESGFKGHVEYEHDPIRSSSYTYEEPHIPGVTPGIIRITPHAFKGEPGGLKSVFYHEFGHFFTESNAGEIAADMAAINYVKSLYGHTDDILLPLIE